MARDDDHVSLGDLSRDSARDAGPSNAGAVRTTSWADQFTAGHEGTNPFDHVVDLSRVYFMQIGAAEVVFGSEYAVDADTIVSCYVDYSNRSVTYSVARKIVDELLYGGRCDVGCDRGILCCGG